VKCQVSEILKGITKDFYVDGRIRVNSLELNQERLH
jgi:hypothetical protein